VSPGRLEPGVHFQDIHHPVRFDRPGDSSQEEPADRPGFKIGRDQAVGPAADQNLIRSGPGCKP
jgi:hypothetical protein